MSEIQDFSSKDIPGGDSAVQLTLESMNVPNHVEVATKVATKICPIMANKG